MSQFNIRSLREIHSDEQGKFINTLAKRVSTFLNKEQTDKLENKEDVYSAGQDVESVVKFHSFNSTKYFDFNTTYYPPFEPDGDLVKLWVRGRNMGNDTHDWSEFGHIINLLGDPILVDGAPFDYGIHSGGIKSTALRFNRPTSELENQEYISVTDSSDNQVSGISTGISYFIRFKIHSLSEQSNVPRTLFCKLDDSTPNNAVVFTVSTDGRFKSYIKRSGNWYRDQTASSTISVDTVYEAWITYAVNGNVRHIYINNSDKSLTDPGSDPELPGTLTNHDISIFRRGQGTTGGHTYGDLYDFMIYREKVVSTAEVGYHFTNKWTIADIPFGQVAITDYFATWLEAPKQAYTTAGYTSIGYNT